MYKAKLKNTLIPSYLGQPVDLKDTEGNNYYIIYRNSNGDSLYFASEAREVSYILIVRYGSQELGRAEYYFNLEDEIFFGVLNPRSFRVVDKKGNVAFLSFYPSNSPLPLIKEEDEN